MVKRNIVFIATSIDGFIADKDGGIDWLNSVPNPNNDDMGYVNLINRIDAIVMGRTTFEMVCSFDIDWPYTKPVFVLSTTLQSVPDKYKEHVQIVNGTLVEILEQINAKGFLKLYIDGGRTIQSFLKEDLIDELILTKIPVMLGGGIPLFAEMPKPLSLEYIKSEVFLDAITQDTYYRKR